MFNTFKKIVVQIDYFTIGIYRQGSDGNPRIEKRKLGMQEIRLICSTLLHRVEEKLTKVEDVI